MEIYIEEPAENTKKKKDKENKYQVENKILTFIKTKEIEIDILKPFEKSRTTCRWTDDYIPPEKNGIFKIRYAAFSIEAEEKELKYGNYSTDY